jgi:hypothetical protein
LKYIEGKRRTLKYMEGKRRTDEIHAKDIERKKKDIERKKGTHGTDILRRAGVRH